MCNCAINMRYASLFLLAGLCAVAVACKPLGPIKLQPTVEDPPALGSAIQFNEPPKGNQVLRGFYDLQNNAWRWTGPRFAVILASPPGADTRGARLVLDFNLPDASITSLHELTVTARINHVSLAPETFNTQGPHQYQRDVPASAFQNHDVTLDFSVDKFLTPPNDGRNLALIVTAIALEPK